MRMLLAVLFCGLSAVAQKEIEFADTPLRQALQELEREFDVRYSYADSVVDQVSVTLSKNDYTLATAHQAMRSFGVEFTAIDSRYYAVTASSVTTAAVPEVVVTYFLSRGIRLDGDHFKLTPARIEELPGVADADLLLALQQIPGVKSPNETASGLHVRGGTPDQNLILIDGIRLYHPGHLFGMISGVNPQLARHVHFYDKATPSEYGDRISSVVDIRSDDQLTDSLSGSAGVNLLVADASLRTPIIPSVLDLQVTARRSLSPWWESPGLEPLTQKVFQHTDFGSGDKSDFGFHDASVRLGFKKGNTQLAATGILVDNALDYTLASPDRTNRQQLGIRNAGASFSWKQRLTSKLAQVVSAQFSEYAFKHDDREEENDSYSAYVKRNRAVHSGASLTYQFEYDAWDFSAGYQFSGHDVSHSFAQEFPGFAVELGQRQLFVLSHAAYLQSVFESEKWTFRTGLRYSYFTHLETARIEPRLSVSYKISDKTSLIGSYEMRSQVESQVRETATNDLSLENYVWTLSDGRQYPLLRGKQVSLGAVWTDNRWLVSVDGFYKTIDGITSLTNGFMNPDGQQVFRGEGIVKGAELLVQRSARTWRGWISYTLQDATNRFDGVNDDAFFPTSADIRHDFSIGGFKKWGNISTSAGWSLRSGRPFSSVSEGLQNYNDKRLGEYHRLNVSAAYAFKLRNTNAKAGISILNVYDRRPIINREYRRFSGNLQDMVGGSFAVYDYDALGFTPNVFLRLDF